MKKSIIFDELKQVIARLKPFEAEVAQNYLVAFERGQSTDLNKSALALQYMVGNHEITYDLLKEMVSPDLDRYAFNKFLVRLRDKIFDSLLTNVNIHRKGAYSPWFEARQECFKNWILISNLIGRGNEISAIQLMEHTIRRAQEFELYDILAHVLFMKKVDVGFRKGEKAFQRVEQEYVKAEKCRQAFLIASDYNVRHFMITDRESSLNERVGFLSEALSDLEKIYAETGVSEVGQYLHLFGMEFHQAMGDFKAARVCGDLLIELVKSRPALNAPYKQSAAYINIAFNDMLLLDFPRAIENCSLALNDTGSGSYNHIAINTVKAQIEYYNQDLEASFSTCEGMLSANYIKIAPFEKAKLNYIKASIHFSRGEFSKAYEIYNTDSILIDADNEGWNTGFRIMRIICLIEMSLKDLADMSIEAMRKHMQKTSDESGITTRDKAIIKILRNLEQKNFDFKKTYFKNQSLFYQLASDDAEYSWKVKSHELVVFHEWFKCKMENKRYQFSIPHINKLEKVKLKGRATSWEE
jgi:tetratricopeptide (TPR) repeat protein